LEKKLDGGQKFYPRLISECACRHDFVDRQKRLFYASLGFYSCRLPFKWCYLWWEFRQNSWKPALS